MKQQKLTDYVPSYPKRFLRGAALTAAALVAISGAAGCAPALLGEAMIAEPTEEPMILGGLRTADPCEPTEAPVATEGMVAVPEPTETPLLLEGEMTIWEPEDTDAAPEL